MAACSTWLHSSALSHAVLPALCHRNTFRRPSNFRSIHLFHSTGNLIYSLNRFKTAPAMAVQAQSKGGFSAKDDDVASADDLRFEAPLEIVNYPDPRLRARNKRINTYDKNLKTLVDEMFDVMYRTDGVGLAASQVGINVQLMVFNTEGKRGEGEEIVLVNPRVSNYSKKVVPFEEGCLSFPDIFRDVMRPESVKIDACDITGAKFSLDLSELPARVFLHEFDHLEGKLFIDSMTEEVLDSIRIELEALEKEYENKTGLPSPERVESRQRLKAAAATAVGKS